MYPLKGAKSIHIIFNHNMGFQNQLVSKSPDLKWLILGNAEEAHIKLIE